MIKASLYKVNNRKRMQQSRKLHYHAQARIGQLNALTASELLLNMRP